MNLKVDYFTALSRAVARVDHDSYAARGIVYDREQRALERRLASADPAYSDEEIAIELAEFREAVRQVEFGETAQDQPAELAEPELPEPELPEPEPEPPPLRQPPPLREPPLQMRRPQPLGLRPRSKPMLPEVEAPLTADMPEAELTAADVAAMEDVVPVREYEPPGQFAEPEGEPDALPLPPQKSVIRRVVDRLLVAAILIGIGTAGFAYLSGDLDLSSLQSLVARVMPGGGSSEPELSGTSRPVGSGGHALLYEGDRTDPAVKPLQGKAQWGSRTETSSSGKQSTVVTLDVDVPERGLGLAMSIRRDGEEGAAIGHLIEMRFTGANGFNVDDIAKVTGIVMKPDEQGKGQVLVGQLIKVAPGLFLLGLSGQPADVSENIRLLQQPWLDIGIGMRNGDISILAVEKGAAGERAVKDGLANWGH